MHILIIVLRLIHILSGVFWLGGSFIALFFLTPAVAATGEAGQKFMGHMVTKGHLTARITGAAVLTVLAGAVLYWIDFGRAYLTLDILRHRLGGFGIGAVFALIGLGFGMVVGQNIRKLGTIGAAAQGKPTQAQILEMQAAQKQMAMAALVSNIALVIALACMATARYWGI